MQYPSAMQNGIMNEVKLKARQELSRAPLAQNLNGLGTQT